MSFDVNILVNGNRCKQYNYNGRTYVEAKHGSEYVIEIKNNHHKRVLAVGSVDSLNVLTGKTASDTDSGYIINPYSTEKIKGFRYSDTEWAMFKFGYKFYGNTYAQSKEDGSEKNCGVIGMRFFYEKEPIVVWNTIPNWLNKPSTTVVTTTTTTYPATYAASSSYSIGTGAYQSNVNYTCNTLGTQTPTSTNYQSLFGGCAASPQMLNEAIKDAKAVRQTALANPKSAGRFQKLAGTKGGGEKISAKVKNRGGGQSSTSGGPYGEGRFGYTDNVESERYDASLGRSLVVDTPKEYFDIGTEFGRRERSKVINVTFDRGCLAQSFDIYYASREALINMGVPLTNELAVNLPQSFPNQYCTPPVGWNG